SLGALRELALFVFRQSRERIKLVALVERRADDVAEHDDLAGARDVARDGAAALPGLLGRILGERLLILRTLFPSASDGAVLSLRVQLLIKPLALAHVLGALDRRQVGTA